MLQSILGPNICFEMLWLGVERTEKSEKSFMNYIKRAYRIMINQTFQ